MFTPRSLEAWVCFSGGAESKQQARNTTGMMGFVFVVLAFYVGESW
jgi:hypothetical protein